MQLKLKYKYVDINKPMSKNNFHRLLERNRIL